MNSDQDKQLRLYLLITACIAGGLLCIYFGWFFYLKIPLSTNSQDWGSLGDYFNGFASPLLSFVMIIAIIRTITLQRQMINEQRTQITQSNNLMRVSTAIQGITSMMNYHETYSKTFIEFNNELLIEKNKLSQSLIENNREDQSLSPNTPAKRINELQRDYLLREIEKNQNMILDHGKVVSAHKAMAVQCYQVLSLLSLATPESADKDISDAGTSIDTAYKHYVLPTEIIPPRR